MILIKEEHFLGSYFLDLDLVHEFSFAFSNNHLKDFGKLNNNMCHAKRSCGFLES